MLHPEYVSLSGRSLHKWPPGRPETGHPADALTLGTTYSSVPGRGRIPFPIDFASGLPHYWPRFSSSHLARPLHCPGPPVGQGLPSFRSGLRLLGVFVRLPTRKPGPKRWRGSCSFGPSLKQLSWLQDGVSWAEMCVDPSHVHRPISSLFTVVRGIEIPRSSYPASCIARSSGASKAP